MVDRRVHATTPDWEIARYDRPGKWFIEWVGSVGAEPRFLPSTLRMVPIARTGRAKLSAQEAAQIAHRLGAAVHLNMPGGSTFDRHIERLVA